MKRFYLLLLISTLLLPSLSYTQNVSFEDDFETDKGWSSFEEIVGGNPCYEDSIGEVARSTEFSSGGSYSLRIWANKKGSPRSNHVIGRLKLSDNGLTGRYYVYSLDAYIPVDSDTGQTGPEFSVQSTKNVSGTNLTYVAGIQYIGNPHIDNGTRWQIWHNGGWTPFMNLALTKGEWYNIALAIDLDRNEYAGFSFRGRVDGVIVSIDIDPDLMRTYNIKGEDRNFQPATEITLEGENLETCLHPRFTQFKIYYDNVKLNNTVNAVQTPNVNPINFNLSQNYPNPFNPTTAIEYSIHKSGFVVLEIYDTLGQKVKMLVRKQLAPGIYRATWDGTTDSQQKVSTGTYLCQLKVDGQVKSIRMIFME